MLFMSDGLSYPLYPAPIYSAPLFSECGCRLANLVTPYSIPSCPEALGDGGLDYALRCTKGLFCGRFICINRSGEIFGSADSAHDVTMCIQTAGLSPRHTAISYDPATFRYRIGDLNSNTGTYLKLRHDRPKRLRGGQIIRVSQNEYLVGEGQPLTTRGAYIKFLKVYGLSPLGDFLAALAGGYDLRLLSNSDVQNSPNLDNLPEEIHILVKLAFANLHHYLPIETKSRPLLFVSTYTGKVVARATWTGCRCLINEGETLLHYLSDVANTSCGEASKTGGQQIYSAEKYSVDNSRFPDVANTESKRLATSAAECGSVMQKPGDQNSKQNLFNDVPLHFDGRSRNNVMVNGQNELYALHNDNEMDCDDATTRRQALLSHCLDPFYIANPSRDLNAVSVSSLMTHGGASNDRPLTNFCSPNNPTLQHISSGMINPQLVPDNLSVPCQEATASVDLGSKKDSTMCAVANPFPRLETEAHYLYINSEMQNGPNGNITSVDTTKNGMRLLDGHTTNSLVIDAAKTETDSLTAGGVLNDVASGGVLNDVASDGVLDDVTSGGVLNTVASGSVLNTVASGSVLNEVTSDDVSSFIAITKELRDQKCLRTRNSDGHASSVKNMREDVSELDDEKDRFEMSNSTSLGQRSRELLYLLPHDLASLLFRLVTVYDIPNVSVRCCDNEFDVNMSQQQLDDLCHSMVKGNRNCWKSQNWRTQLSAKKLRTDSQIIRRYSLEDFDGTQYLRVVSVDVLWSASRNRMSGIGYNVSCDKSSLLSDCENIMCCSVSFKHVVPLNRDTLLDPLLSSYSFVHSKEDNTSSEISPQLILLCWQKLLSAENLCFKAIIDEKCDTSSDTTTACHSDGNTESGCSLSSAPSEDPILQDKVKLSHVLDIMQLSVSSKEVSPDILEMINATSKTNLEEITVADRCAVDVDEGSWHKPLLEVNSENDAVISNAEILTANSQSQNLSAEYDNRTTDMQPGDTTAADNLKCMVIDATEFHADEGSIPCSTFPKETIVRKSTQFGVYGILPYDADNQTTENASDDSHTVITLSLPLELWDKSNNEVATNAKCSDTDVVIDNGSYESIFNLKAPFLHTDTSSTTDEIDEPREEDVTNSLNSSGTLANGRNSEETAGQHAINKIMKLPETELKKKQLENHRSANIPSQPYTCQAAAIGCVSYPQVELSQVTAVDVPSKAVTATDVDNSSTSIMHYNELLPPLSDPYVNYKQLIDFDALNKNENSIFIQNILKLSNQESLIMRLDRVSRYLAMNRSKRCRVSLRVHRDPLCCPRAVTRRSMIISFNNGFYEARDIDIDNPMVEYLEQESVDIWLKLLPYVPDTLHPDDTFSIGDLNFTVMRYNCGIGGQQGFRATMEDEELTIQDFALSESFHSSFFAVYDGHGGRECAQFIRKTLHNTLKDEINTFWGGFDNIPPGEIHKVMYKALHRSFLRCDEAYLSLPRASSLIPGGIIRRSGPGCASVVVIILGRTIWCANCGDARAVLSRDGVALQLSSDHKPERPDEQERITRFGGFVRNKRVLGRLAVSRAFGDIDYKKSGNGNHPLVSAEPEIRHEILQPEDEFCLLACDGLFDVFSSQDAVNFVREKLALMPKTEQDPQRVVQDLIREAIQNKRSRDNVTAILLTFKRNISLKHNNRKPSRN